MKAFTANFSDLTGATNPRGIWSPAFLALKLALDRGEQPDNVVQLLYDWLSQRNIKPSELDTLLDLPSDKAYETLVGMVNRTMNPKGMPKLVRDTLWRAIQRIAHSYITPREKELERPRLRLRGIRSRFNVESASGLVSRLLER